MALGDRNGHVADNTSALRELRILTELGSACRELKARAEAAREEEQRLVFLEMEAADVHGRDGWEARPAAYLFNLYAELAERRVDWLEEAHAGWVAWYAAAASELMIARAAGEPVEPDVIKRSELLRRGGRDTCPELPHERLPKLGIENHDDAVADALVAVRRAHLAWPRAQALKRRIDRVWDREGRDSERAARMWQRFRDLEDEQFQLADRLYAYGQTIEAALTASLAAPGRTSR